MEKDENVKVKKVKKVVKKNNKKNNKISGGEIVGLAGLILIFLIIVLCFYFFLRKDSNDILLEHTKYAKYKGGNVNINEVLDLLEDDSFGLIIDKINYSLVKNELDSDDKEQLDENIDNAVEELKSYYASDEDLNNAIVSYTGYKDLEEYKEKEIKVMESYSLYATKYCKNNDIEEDLCTKYSSYYQTKALYELRKDKKIKFNSKRSRDAYDEYTKNIEDKLEQMKTEMETAEKGYDNIISVTYDEFEELINNKESFIVVATQTGCVHCENYLPILSEVLVENEIVGVQINITDYSAEEKEKLGEILQFEGTPATFFFKNGKLNGKGIEGEKDADELQKLIDKATYLK